MCDTTTKMRPIVAKGALADHKTWAMLGYAGPRKDGRTPLYLPDGTEVGVARGSRRRDVLFEMAALAGKARRSGNDQIRPATPEEIESRYGYSPKRARRRP